MLIKREVLIFGVENWVRALFLAIALRMLLRLPDLFVGLVVGVLVQALRSVVVFLVLGEFFFRGFMPSVLEDDFAGIYWLEKVLLAHRT